MSVYQCVIPVGDKVYSYGLLNKIDDAWLLKTPGGELPLDVPFSIENLNQKHVSVFGVIGTTGSSGTLACLVAKIVTHDDIVKMAFRIHRANVTAVSPDDDWFRAERLLLGLPDA